MNTPIHWTRYASPLGPMLLAARPTGLLGAWFEGQAHFDGIAPGWSEQPGDALLQTAVTQLGEWYAGRRRVFELPLAPLGTPFQQTVWQAIAQIGFADQRSYGALAQALGRPGAARAVGAATGRNPLSIIVPCHRLLGQNGALTGYAGGLARKRALLAFETGSASAWADFESCST